MEGGFEGFGNSTVNDLEMPIEYSQIFNLEERLRGEIQKAYGQNPKELIAINMIELAPSEIKDRIRTTYSLRDIFKDLIEAKSGWGKNEIMAAFDAAARQVLGG
jgi:hypothetical protein